MKVVLDKAFPLDATADGAWQLMQDIEAVAGCMPGAKITERIDDTHYKGTITVRLGPATMSFKGDIEVLELDTGKRRLHLLGKGTDATGGSAATMDLTASVEPAGGACTLMGKSEVSMSGKAAAIGGRLMGPVSEQLLKQFVANFSARLDAMEASRANADSAPNDVANAPSSPGTAPATHAATASSEVMGSTQVQDVGVVEAAQAERMPVQTETAAGTDDRLHAADRASSEEASIEHVAASASASAPALPPGSASTTARPFAPAPAQANELNGLTLLWAIVRDWLRGLFSPKTQGR